MKKILIISEAFAPNNVIASIRLTKLAKYFKLESDYHITVISRALQDHELIDPVLNENLQYIDKQILINYSKLMGIIANRSQKVLANNRTINFNEKEKNLKDNTFIKIFLFINKSIRPVIRHEIDKNYTKMAIKYIKKNIDKYNVILSSYSPLSSHLIAEKIKKCNPDALWIADFRDPVITHMTPKKYINYFKSYINNISQKADIITGVGYSCIQDFEKSCKNNLRVICNGFDRDDIKNIKAIPCDKFTLTYTGLLYEGKRDLSVIFKAIRELINENKLKAEKIVINYAGRSVNDFRKQIEKYNLSQTAYIHGFINRMQSLQLQVNSNMLLLASWNSVGETDAITGKFLEYMMINKPVVCAVTGNLANSKLKEMMTAANNGIVWEEANGEHDYINLKSYISEQYDRFIYNKPLLFAPNMEYIEQYNYKNLARQFIDLIENK